MYLLKYLSLQCVCIICFRAKLYKRHEKALGVTQKSDAEGATLKLVL